jgi:hypothetical protein
MRYQVFRSLADVHVFVLCKEGRFNDDVPRWVYDLGPWRAMNAGDVQALNPHYFEALARDGYVMESRVDDALDPEAFA